LEITIKTTYPELYSIYTYFTRASVQLLSVKYVKCKVYHPYTCAKVLSSLSGEAAAPHLAAPPCASTISPQTIPSQLSSYKSRTLPHDFHNLPTLPIFKPKISHGRQQVASSKLVLRCNNESARHHFRTLIPFSRTSRVCLLLYVQGAPKIDEH
jgi:hypothetical protein